MGKKKKVFIPPEWILAEKRLYYQQSKWIEWIDQKLVEFATICGVPPRTKKKPVKSWVD